MITDKLKEWFFNKKKDSTVDGPGADPKHSLHGLMLYLGYNKDLVNELTKGPKDLEENLKENLQKKLMATDKKFNKVMLFQKGNLSFLAFQVAFLLGIKNVQMVNFTDEEAQKYSKASDIKISDGERCVYVINIEKEKKKIPDYEVSVSLQSSKIESDMKIFDFTIDNIEEVSEAIRQEAKGIMYYTKTKSIFGGFRNGFRVIFMRKKKKKSRAKSYSPEEIMSIAQNIGNTRENITFEHILSGVKMVFDNIDKLGMVPGVNKFKKEEMDLMKQKIFEVRKIIESMTINERRSYHLLSLNIKSPKQSRIQRIADGSKVSKETVKDFISKIIALLQNLKSNPAMIKELLNNVSQFQNNIKN